MVSGHMALEMIIQALGFPEGSGGHYHTLYLCVYDACHCPQPFSTGFCDIKNSDGTMDEAKIEDLITEKPLRYCRCTCMEMYVILRKFRELPTATA